MELICLYGAGLPTQLMPVHVQTWEMFSGTQFGGSGERELEKKQTKVVSCYSERQEVCANGMKVTRFSSTLLVQNCF
jgi:hypothetical protein